MRPETIEKNLRFLHAEWRAKPVHERPSSFRLYVVKENRRLWSALRDDPRVLGTLPKAMQRDWTGEKVKPLTKQALKKHMPSLSRRYRALNNDQTFEEFLNEVVRRRETEADLLDFLTEKPAPAGKGA